MNTRFPLLSFTLLGAGALFAAEPAKPPSCPAPEAKPACCVVENTTAGVAAKAAAAACCVEEKPVAPLTARSLYQLDANWTNDAGASVRLASFRGKPVVLAMFFAQCEYACPVLVNDIQRLRAALPEAIRKHAQVVLVSFDTARDTPAALAAYRERASLDASWALLRGDDNAVQELAMLLGVKFKQDARGQFSHSNLFTILNSDGEVVRQQLGLNGDVSETAKALTLIAK
jgi:protein SCO1/2